MDSLADILQKHNDKSQAIIEANRAKIFGWKFALYRNDHF